MPEDFKDNVEYQEAKPFLIIGIALLISCVKPVVTKNDAIDEAREWVRLLEHEASV